jgi:hypothetical protein
MKLSGTVSDSSKPIALVTLRIFSLCHSSRRLPQSRLKKAFFAFDSFVFSQSHLISTALLKKIQAHQLLITFFFLQADVGLKQRFSEEKQLSQPRKVE